MAVTWWLYSTLVALLLGLAAAAGEGALRGWASSTRWLWVGALVGSLLLPLVTWFNPFGWSSPVAGLVPDAVVIAAPPLVVGETESAGSAGVGQWLGWGWAFSSLLVAAALLVSLGRLWHSRREWRRSVVDDVPVWLSPRVGPAVVGLVRGSIVVPEWVLSLDRRLRRLILLHEREHVREGDPLLVMLGLLALVAAPWNLPLWWQFRRLRLAIELDCDARVLSVQRDLRPYGMLLLEVARRRSSGEHLFSVALLNPRSHLERRIRAMTPSLSGRMRRLLGLGGVAGLLVLAAFCADVPTAVQAPEEVVPEIVPRTFDDNPIDLVLLPPTSGDLSEAPAFTPMDVEPVLQNAQEVASELGRAYPPLLRDAGIGGTVLVWFFIDENGRVQNTEINQSSGHEALDGIAVEIADLYEFSPALNRDERVRVWVSIPIHFEST